MKVKTRCYNQVKEWDSREDAIEFFREGMLSCDPSSSESTRYASVLIQLRAGLDYATDDLYREGE